MCFQSSKLEKNYRKGANVTHLSKDGKNALDHAIDAGRESCAMLLINHDEWEKVLRNKIVVEKGELLPVK